MKLLYHVWCGSWCSRSLRLHFCSTVPLTSRLQLAERSGDCAGVRLNRCAGRLLVLPSLQEYYTLVNSGRAKRTVAVSKSTAISVLALPLAHSACRSRSRSPQRDSGFALTATAKHVSPMGFPPRCAAHRHSTFLKAVCVQFCRVCVQWRRRFLGWWACVRTTRSTYMALTARSMLERRERAKWRRIL